MYATGEYGCKKDDINFDSNTGTGDVIVLNDEVVPQGRTEGVINCEITAPPLEIPGDSSINEDICGGGSSGCAQTGSNERGADTIISDTGINEERGELEHENERMMPVDNVENAEVPGCIFYHGSCKQHKLKGNKTVM